MGLGACPWFREKTSAGEKKTKSKNKKKSSDHKTHIKRISNGRAAGTEGPGLVAPGEQS
jgi:hypothetical protein